MGGPGGSRRSRKSRRLGTLRRSVSPKVPGGQRNSGGLSHYPEYTVGDG